MQDIDVVAAKLGPGPIVHPDCQDYWAELASGRLCVPRCRRCGTVRFPILSVCHGCLSREAEPVILEETGRVVVSVVVHHAPKSGVWASAVPYRTGLVSLGELQVPGRILCHCGAADVPGCEVQVGRVPAVDGGHVWAFQHLCGEQARPV